ncbi:MAG: NPCBM/NEW2 domain-containing protein [Phycisphaerales bacterium]|nr:MAG: NPCBM/NEW2 domain-containing protein [Phycisphaerales bacterium]
MYERTRRSSSQSLWRLMGCCALLLCGVRQAGATVTVKIVTITGMEISGEWKGSSDTNGITIATEAGQRVLPLDEVAAVVIQRPRNVEVAERGQETVFYPSDGGQLPGTLLGSSKEGVIASTALGQGKPLPFNRLAGILFNARPADPHGISASHEEHDRGLELFESAMNDRRSGEDLLIVRSDGKARSLPGTLVSLDPADAAFRFGDRTRTIKTENILGVVFASGVQKQVDCPTTFELRDGSVFTARLRSGSAERITVESSVGVVAELDLSVLARMRFRSSRVVYVSDLTPVTQRVEGRLHREWPVGHDRSLTGDPLSIAGRTFDKGLGMHSRTEVAYAIEGHFESFAATIGIDDSVRPAGSVVFRMIGDGQTLFDSGLITGKDQAVNVLVDVKSIKDLTLVVDYGDDLDLSDHAVWGAARLIKPAENRKHEGVD